MAHTNYPKGERFKTTKSKPMAGAYMPSTVMNPGKKKPKFKMSSSTGGTKHVIKSAGGGY